MVAGRGGRDAAAGPRRSIAGKSSEASMAESTSLMTRTREFVKEVQVESTKVSWPSRNELRDSTLVVIVTVLIVSAFVGIVDQVLTVLVRMLFR